MKLNDSQTRRTFILALFMGATMIFSPTLNAKEISKVIPYPLKTCVVSGDKLGEMGKPVTFVYKNQEIKLCCKDCRKDFDKEPEKYLKQLTKKK
jgi:hypothetical protein